MLLKVGREKDREFHDEKSGNVLVLKSCDLK